MKEMNLAGLTPWGGLAGHPVDSADVIVAGIPYDGSAVYRKGAAPAPVRIRELSAVMPPVIAGGRDYDPEELEFIRARGMLLVSASELAGDSGSARMVADALDGKSLHISFDIDALDPAFAPGTEIPSAGGLSTRQALDFLRIATAGSKLVGLDVVEVSPPFDIGAINTLAALKLIFEFWGLAWSRRGAPGSHA